MFSTVHTRKTSSCTVVIVINPQSNQGVQRWAGEINGQPVGGVLVVDSRPLDFAAVISRNLKESVRRPKPLQERRGPIRDRRGLREVPLADNRRMNERLAVVSHELRNSLGVIHNATGLLKMIPDESPVAKKARLIVERQVAQMARLIGDLLEVSRIKSGRLALQSQRVDLCAVVRHAVESVELEIGRRGQRLAVSLPDAPLWLEGDASRLEQVLVNLLGNAAKYTETGGQLQVSVEREIDQATIRVRDSGIGIAAGVLPHIFEPFMQASASARAEAGIGIGLALVSSVVTLHGGDVMAASAGLGQGSEFTVHLPLICP